MELNGLRRKQELQQELTERESMLERYYPCLYCTELKFLASKDQFQRACEKGCQRLKTYIEVRDSFLKPYLDALKQKKIGDDSRFAIEKATIHIEYTSK
jgi:transcription elongation factor Elf1